MWLPSAVLQYTILRRRPQTAATQTAVQQELPVLQLPPDQRTQLSPRNAAVKARLNERLTCLIELRL